MKLKLERPLIFFDLETTGTNVTEDRIVEFSYIKIYPDGTEETKSRRLNPEMHIPAEATAIHHITDDDVRNEPTFRQVSKALLAIFDNCDVAGYNSNRFDVPLLIEEFSRAGLTFDTANRRFVDVQNIFHKMEPRTLVGAYKYYCGKDLEGAHSATADTRATYEVLLGQLEKYDTLENDINALAEFSRNGRDLDLSGRIALNDNNVPVFKFGKHKGKPVADVLRQEPSYYSWIMQGDFPKTAKDVITRIYGEVRARKD